MGADVKVAVCKGRATNTLASTGVVCGPSIRYASRGTCSDTFIPPPAGRDSETLRAYWLHHRQRSTELEQQRLQVNNFVVASSVVALGIVAATDAPNTAVVVVVGLAVALFNLMAWAYSWQSDRRSHYYSARAQRLLVENWLYLKHLEAEVREPVKRPHEPQDWFRRVAVGARGHGPITDVAW
jgi:hypothetical protein